MTLQINDQT